MSQDDKNQEPDKKTRRPSRWIAIGVAIGAGIGVASGNLGLWIGVGVAIGIVGMRIDKMRNSK